MNESTLLAGTETLVIEDDLMMRKRLARFLEEAGSEVTAVSSVKEAENCLDSMNFDLALVDINLPDGLGLDLLRKGLFSPNTQIVIMTADEGISTAVEAMRLGAADYLTKPFDLEELPLVYKRAKKMRSASRREEYRKERETTRDDALFWGKDSEGLNQQLERILDTDHRLENHLPPILIEGETGTGKTSLARYIHGSGPRKHSPLMEINCSALPESLVESELFGHEVGAFTDARSARIGLFEAADGGTLFLDEITSLSQAVQAKILKVVEDGKVRRVGGNREISVDVRIITATNIPLKKAVADGLFREDLFHRLDLLRITIPPLRERKREFPDLVKFLLRNTGKKYRRKNLTVSPQGWKRLQAYHWPGNIRELAHEIERQVILQESDQLHFESLRNLTEEAAEATPSDQPVWLNPEWSFPESGFNLNEAQQKFIQLALKQSNGNVSQAARLLGVSRDFLRYRVEK